MSAVMKNHQHADMWTLVPLKEIGLWSGGGTPSKAKPEFWADGTIPWVSPKDMKTDRIADSEDHITQAAIEGSTTKLIPAGSVLIVTRSGILSHTLPIAVTVVPVTVNQDLKAITPRDGVSPDYVAWAIRCFAREILNTCSKQGTTVSSIETAALQRFVIPLPALDQQKRIVAEIEKQFSRLDEAVAGLKRVKANLKRYKAAVLKTAVEGRLVETEADLARREGRSYETGEQLLQRILETRRSQWKGKGKYKEPAVPDTTNLPELPEGWVWVTLGQLAFVDVGYAFKSNEFETAGIRLLRGENIEPGRLRWDDTRYWSERKLDGYRSLLVQVGEIILAMDRPLVTAGLKLARVSHADVPCLLVQRMARMRCVFRETEGYLYAAMQTHRFELHLLGGQTGTQLPHISGAGISSFVMPLPPAQEQHRIVAETDRHLSLLRETEAQVDANLQRAERLRQSVLARTFNNCLSDA